MSGLPWCQSERW